MSGRLDGLRVVVTRSATQASGLSDRLRSLGAVPIEIAMIEIAEPSDGGAALRSAASRIDDYDWIVVASPNGARALLTALGEHGHAADAMSPRLACVGPSTASILTDAGHVVDVVPDRFVAEGLVESMPAPQTADERVLVVQAEVGRPVIEDGLVALGYEVERVAGYRSIDAPVIEADRVAAGAADLATFTSSSTVERFVRLVGREHLPAAIACIGPITTATARDLGLDVDVEAEVSTIDGLIAAIVTWANQRTT